MTSNRLTSTGRRPALSPSDVERLLGRYFGEDKPSLPTLAEEFAQTGKDGKVRPLSLATVRRYLTLAGVTLPRGRAAEKPRVAPGSVRTMMNRIPTEVLIGKGSAELILRRLERGEKVTALANEFGISKDRVSRLRNRHQAPEAPVEVEEAGSVEEAPEECQASAAVEAEVSEAPEPEAEPVFGPVEEPEVPSEV